MSKKDFTGGLDSLLGSAGSKPNKGTSKEGTAPGETRATILITEASWEKVKDIAYWDRIMIKEVVAAAFDDFISRYEQQHGKIKPRPKNK